MRDDIEFLGLRSLSQPGSFEFIVEERLARHDGYLYGGTAIAVSIAAAELMTDRAAQWMTTQFVATAPPLETVTVQTEVLAQGKRTNQVRVTGTDSSGQTMFASLGATGIPKEGGMSGEFERAPKVSRPEDSDPDGSPFEAMLRHNGIDVPKSHEARNTGFSKVIEFREASVLDHPDPGPGRMCFWVGRRDGRPITPAVAAFMADMVPVSVAHAVGLLGGGISLDNTIRVGAYEESEWILIDMRPAIANGGYGHGSVFIWSESAKLVAIAGQSCSMITFDVSELSLDHSD